VTLDGNGFALRPGEPEYTDDDRFWDGTRWYRLVDADVRKRQGVLLGEADVVVLNATDCCPGVGRCGSKRLADEKIRLRLATAGFVRFAERSGSLQRWHADDGTVLALLVGTVTRPALD
jgi:hypothetical protein